METILMFVLNVVLVILLFGFTIFVHELGHFLVARWCGLVVETFAIGFGPSLWKKKIKGVVYKINVLPLGGYVALPQMDPTLGHNQEEEARKGKLPPVAPWKKILVGLAGVTMNMVLAFVLAWIVYVKGMPVSPDELSTVVGFVETDSEAYQAGIRARDEILSVDGEKVENWQEFLTICALKDDATLLVKSPDGALKEAHLKIVEHEELNFRLIPGLSGEDFCRVMDIVKGSSAEAAGLQPDDVITEWNGILLKNRSHMIELVNKSANQEAVINVERGDEELALKVTPAVDAALNRAVIGIKFYQIVHHPTPLAQVKSHSKLIFRILQAFMTPKEAKNAAGSIGGPSAIFYMFYLMVATSLMQALWFTSLLNVNLAILNLLPIPILDGGHLVFSFYEMVTRRRVHPKIVLVLSNIFFLFFILIFIALTYRDFSKFILPMQKQIGESREEQRTNSAPSSPDGKTDVTPDAPEPEPVPAAP